MISSEHVLKIFYQAVMDFKPNYIRRFSAYENFQTTFPFKEDFFEFFSLMLNHAKGRHVGNLALRIDPDYPTYNEGFTAYNYYDQEHRHPVFGYEVRVENKTMIFGMGPF